MPERKSRIDGERTRGKILAAAEREFAEKGYELASVREISRRVGVNMALANRYFGSKEGLYRIVDDFLFMTFPTEPAQAACAALFRHEVTRPTKFHAEFQRDFGKPVYDSLRNLLARAIKDETQLKLWTTSVWAQVSVYALADTVWHVSFRPAGVGVRDWAAQVRDHICANLFASVKFPMRVLH